MIRASGGARRFTTARVAERAGVSGGTARRPGRCGAAVSRCAGNAGIPEGRYAPGRTIHARSQSEVNRLSDAMSDMLCAYLASLTPKSAASG
jgi:hypothetical protein